MLRSSFLAPIFLGKFLCLAFKHIVLRHKCISQLVVGLGIIMSNSLSHSPNAGWSDSLILECSRDLLRDHTRTGRLILIGFNNLTRATFLSTVLYGFP